MTTPRCLTIAGLTLFGMASTFFASSQLAAGNDAAQSARSLTVSTIAAQTGSLSDAKELRVYFGTYTRGGKSEGIYTAVMSLDDGSLSEPVLAGKETNPSFLAIDPIKNRLYSVSEVTGENGKPTGGVASHMIERKTGQLSLLNRQPSGGAGPCHVSVSKNGKALLVACYGGGTVASLPISDFGLLWQAESNIQHTGSSVNPQRQEGPHAHSVNLDPQNHYAFVADLGLDQVVIYRFDADAATLTPNNPPYVKVPPGSGPRHFVFHPSGRFAYVINEMASTVTAFEYDSNAGKLTAIETISTLPADFEGDNSTAEVRVTPDGRFLYGSNRGHDSLAGFAIDSETGRLKLISHQSTLGKTPRNFEIDPTGKFIIAANQASDSVHVFRIDAKTGVLQPTGHSRKVASPVCVKFLLPAES